MSKLGATAVSFYNEASSMLWNVTTENKWKARELKWGGGSLVNKLAQAALCLTKVNHQILVVRQDKNFRYAVLTGRRH